MPGATVDVINSNGIEVASTLADSMGRFHTYISYDESYGVIAEKKDYTQLDQARISTLERPFILDTIVIYMWKHKLFAEGRIFSNELQAVLPDAAVTLENLTDDTITKVVTGDE